MILSRLYLENYKQFREPVELFPPEGAIGVVGGNGSGKTTLFEAILWAFFGSRGGGPRFANDSIPWSGGSTADRTLVEVTLDMGGASYTVSRSLHRNKTTAQIHDEAGDGITSGPAEVAAWVQEHILGMDRVAFEATFFARQKELEFFAGVTGVERQREVARILRINQVEDAQRLLRTDKNDLVKEAKWIEQTLAEADHESLIEDLEEKRELHVTLETKTKELRSEFERRDEELAKARAENERLEGLYRKHNELTNELGKAVSLRDRSGERAVELREKLRSLDEDEKKVAELEPETRGLSEVSKEIEVLEEARRREERETAAKQDLIRHQRAAYDASGEASDLLEDLDADGSLLSGWPEDFESEEVERAREAARVLEVADEAHRRCENELRRLREARERYESLAKLQARLENGEAEIRKSRKQIEEFDREIEETTGGGSLEEKLSSLRERRESLQRRAAQKSGRAEADEGEAEKLGRARRMVEDSDERAECPTCRRGFDKDEHAEVMESLTRQEEALMERAETARRECRRLDSESERVSREIEEFETSRSRVYELREKRTAVETRRENMRRAFEEIEAEAKDIREELSETPPPSPDDLAEAERRVDSLRTLRDARPRLSGLVSEYDRASREVGEREKEIEELSEGPAYDAARHEELTERRSEIQTNLGQIESLKSRLEERPAVEERLKQANEAREESARETERLESEIEHLGFEEEKYAEARRNSSGAERLREESRDRRDEAERELRSVAHAIEGLEKELKRYEEQRRLADEKGLEAASLNDMDGLFSEFYKELTARVRPNLQREASDLLKTLTDGRYEKMEFDENYGVRLYDGLSDAYEISRFSGGEADVASLCARVALSKMISGKGSGALGFIVLDEVFGALDANRRQNVLLALDRLKQTFGQIFVISHVSDVQESALLDETWLVEEDEENKSRVRRVKQGFEEAAELLNVRER
ncbi:MAG: AAA family ATPase [Rubrobacteraceae bacterium]